MADFPKSDTVVAVQCGTCSEHFSYQKRGAGRLRRFCSDRCKVLAFRRSRKNLDCAGCGCAFQSRYVSRAKARRGVYCSNLCWLTSFSESRRVYPTPVQRKRAEDARRRARKQSVPFEDFTREEIFERDGWICGICREPVDRSLAFPDHLSASLDHIVPLSRGGPHTRANSQCSHWICNSRKTNGLADGFSSR